MMSCRAVSKLRCLEACRRSISTSPANQAWFFSKVGNSCSIFFLSFRVSFLKLVSDDHSVLLCTIKAGMRIRFWQNIGPRALYPERQEIFNILLNVKFEIILLAFFFVFILLVSDVLYKPQSPGSGPNESGSESRLVYWI